MTNEQKAFCTQCGAPLEQGSVFCSECGNHVTEPDPIYNSGPNHIPNSNFVYGSDNLAKTKANGRIDKIYFCPDMESKNRKPNPGMGLKALKEFDEIDLSKSIMIGNTLSDMKFGRNLGVAINIFLPTTRKDVDLNDKNIDLVFDSLINVAKEL